MFCSHMAIASKVIVYEIYELKSKRANKHKLCAKENRVDRARTQKYQLINFFRGGEW